jgi:hypothetical protein
MGLSGFNQLGKSIADEGKFHFQYVYKPTVPAHSTAGYFIDLNQSSGSPKYNPFAGAELTSTPLIGSGNAGIYPGNFISGHSKHLARIQLLQIQGTNGAPDFVYLNDYLMFYPLIDCDNVDQQDMTNVETLPRYTDGKGVRIVLIASAPMALTASITINYTNSNGVSGRTSTANVIPALNIGVCATAGGGTAGGANRASPFWPLASGDEGVRSIESVTFAAGAGGFLIAALVKPIAQISIYENNVINEKTYGFEHVTPPEILEGAYLNFLIGRGSSGTGNYRGELIFINS